jgi:hypothetical protein
LGGRGKNGDSLYVSTWEFGNGSSISDTGNIDTRFMYSGDPVAGTGWLNNTPIDQRAITTTGPFDLNEGEPVEIICAYIVGRGTTSLNSITVAKGINHYAQNLYQNNFNELVTGINDNQDLSNLTFELQQNYPNPFNPTTTIKFTVAAVVDANFASSTNVVLNIYDILGRKIKTLINEYKPAGTYEVQFDASSLSSGVYFYQLSAGDFVQTKKLMLIK